MKIQSDPHGDMGSQAEMIWPLDDPAASGKPRVVTKVPKVGMPFDVQRVLPLIPVTVCEQSAICWKTRCILHYSSFKVRDTACL
jgi:hypothetical protein